MDDLVKERIRQIQRQALEGKVSREEAERRIEDLKNEGEPRQKGRGWKWPFGRN